MAIVERLSTRAAGSDRLEALNASSAQRTQAPIAPPTSASATAPATPIDHVTVPPPEWKLQTQIAKLGDASNNGSPKRQRLTGSPPATSPDVSTRLASRSLLGDRATAVYITGTASLEPGRRYTISVEESRLRVLGPVDVDPERVVLDRILADVDATAIESRLMVSEPSNRSGLVMAFMSVAGMTADDFATTIAESARAATRP